MILTITMNPAVDKTVSIDHFQVNHVNRIKDIRLDAAGKGINVSKMVKQLGGRTKTFAFLGGTTGAFIKSSLEKERVGVVSVEVEQETRTNIKVVDYQSQAFTDINEPGPTITDDQVQLLIKKLINYISSESLVVFTGSVPPGVSKTIYRELIEKVQRIGAKAVLDADGELFKWGIEAGPYLIKPNIHELEGYVGSKLEDENAIIQAARNLLAYGTEWVVITLGSEGALFVSKDKVIRSLGLKVDVKGTVGAGDSMLGALCYGLDKQLPLEEIVKLGIAASAAKVGAEGTQIPELNDIYALMDQVQMQEERYGN